MKSKKRLIALLLIAAVAMCGALALPTAASAAVVPTAAHIEQYRPQLGYTPNEHWNNDPNGLLYVPNASGDGGTYHMYYQYAVTGNRWDAMHWGHATSTDLVHWQEHNVAIEPLWAGDPAYLADDTVPTGPIFSGSAVYVSEEHKARGYKNEAGFYAIFTQPKTAEERDAEAAAEGTTDQRQTVAYSPDGETFAHTEFREVLKTANNLTVGDGDAAESIGLQYPGDFRDPKVFWSDALGKWMMVVGGGEVVQFVSDDLLDWDYVGSTGFWGECPDLFPLNTPDSLSEAFGAQTWVLLLSPEDKPQSHEYNGTSRETHEYPNEYYVLGTCDENGLFTAYEGETLRAFSFGFDSYAVQTFNNAPDGRRIGVSWAANWKTVDDYAEKGSGGLRDNWNGGMTMAYELTLEDVGGALMLARNPVRAFETLRQEVPLYKQTGVTVGASNVLDGVRASVAEIDVTLDVTDTTAKRVNLQLAVSEYEHTDIDYDIESMTLTVDRSRSSLSAKDTARYRIPYTTQLLPQDGKVRIHAYLDWGDLFVSGGKGEASANVAIFPSLFSNGMSLTSDGKIAADVAVYALDGIWDNGDDCVAFDSFYLSARDETLYVGDTLTVLAGSPNRAFDAAAVTYAADGDVVTVEKRGDGSLAVAANKVGRAVVTARYNGHEKQFAVTVLSGRAASDLAFTTTYAGKWVRDDGYVGSASGDGFVYTDDVFTDFSLSATVTARSDNAVAFGFMFAAGDRYHTYYCANYDYAAQQVKLWMSGGESIETYPLALRRGAPVRYAVTVKQGAITVTVNGQTVIATEHGLYEGGHLGLNVFNGAFAFDDIRIAPIYGAGESVRLPVGDAAFLVRNETDKTYLTADDYAVEDGVLSLKQTYVASLLGGKQYAFTVLFASGNTTAFTLDTYTAVQIFDSYRTLGSGDSLTLAMALGTATVEAVLLDGKPVEYALENSSLTLSGDVVAALKTGDHTLRIRTDQGALEYVFGFTVVPPAPVDRTGMIISIVAAVLIGCAAAAFAVYWIAAMKRKGRE